MQFFLVKLYMKSSINRPVKQSGLIPKEVQSCLTRDLLTMP